MSDEGAGHHGNQTSHAEDEEITINDDDSDYFSRASNITDFYEESEPLVASNTSSSSQPSSQVPSRLVRPYYCGELALSPTVSYVKGVCEMGYKYNSCKNWRLQGQSPKTKFFPRVEFLVCNHEKPDAQIQIGPYTFFCHSMVLRAVSLFFQEAHPLTQYFRLDPEQVNPKSFITFYNWIINTRLTTKGEAVLDLFNAASYLRVKHILDQLWLWFSDTKYFRGHRALMLYLKARQYNMEWLQGLMLSRVSNLFLTVVSSEEYVRMTPRAVCSLLDANAIGINTEMEVFMAALRWLLYDVDNREQFGILVLQTVRFNALPLQFLMWLMEYDERPVIFRIVTSAEVEARIFEGIGYNLLVERIDENDPEFLSKLEANRWTLPQPREFIYDMKCPYHTHQISRKRNALTEIEFCSYMDYLKYGSEDDDTIGYF